MQGAQVQSLAVELRSQMPHGASRGQKKKKKEHSCSNVYRPVICERISFQYLLVVSNLQPRLADLITWQRASPGGMEPRADGV